MKKIKQPKKETNPAHKDGGLLFSQIKDKLVVTLETTAYVHLRFKGVNLGKHKGGFVNE